MDLLSTDLKTISVLESENKLNSPRKFFRIVLEQCYTSSSKNQTKTKQNVLYLKNNCLEFRALINALNN